MGYYPSFHGPALYDLNFAWGHETSRLLVEALRPLLAPDARVLDAGTGTGSLALKVAACVPRGSVVGVDREENALVLARHKAVRAGIGNASFERGDALDLRFADGSFDAVTASQLFGDQRKLIPELARRVRPGGLLALARPHAPRSGMLRWRNETLRAFAGRHSPSFDTGPMLMRSYSDPAFLQGLMEENGLEVLLAEEVDLPEGDGWAAHILNLANGTDPFHGTRKNLAAILQADPDDEEAMVPALHEFFELGRSILESGYGGRVDTSAAIMLGRVRGA